jgi:hypothetical protein
MHALALMLPDWSGTLSNASTFDPLKSLFQAVAEVLLSCNVPSLD